MIINNLPDGAIDRIFLYIEQDKQALSAFVRTCKKFKNQFDINKRYQKLAQFILSNYQIVATNMQQPLWFNLKHSRVITFGERHSTTKHQFNLDRVLNGSCINSLWRLEKNAVLLSEIPPLLDTDKLAKYVKPEIKATGRSWDISEFEKNITRAILNNISANIITSVQKILRCNVLDPIEFQQQFEQISAGILNKEQSVLYQNLKEISKPAQQKTVSSVKQIHQVCLIWLLVSRILLLNISRHYLTKLSATNEEQLRIFNEECQVRDRKFITNVNNELKFKKVITLSGSSHCGQKSPLVEYMTEKGVQFVSLLSKSSHKKNNGEQLASRGLFVNPALSLIQRILRQIVMHYRVKQELIMSIIDGESFHRLCSLSYLALKVLKFEIEKHESLFKQPNSF